MFPPSVSSEARALRELTTVAETKASPAAAVYRVRVAAEENEVMPRGLR